MPNQPSDLKSFIAMARAEDYLILDTETSGLKRPAEIVEIAICDRFGKQVYSQLVKPKGAYNEIAASITGITWDMLKDRPIWAELLEEIEVIIKGRPLVVWNATFDRQMFHLSDESNGLNHHDWSGIASWYCAMTAFGEFRGVWDDYHGNYKWWKLTEALRYCGGIIHNAHRAEGDCLMTSVVVQHMLGDLADLALDDIGQATDIPFNADDVEPSDLMTRADT